MFGIGLPELILILGIALIVVGPDKLPELAKSLAKGVNELKKTAMELKDSFDEEVEGGAPFEGQLNEKYPSLPSTMDAKEGEEQIDGSDLKPAKVELAEEGEVVDAAPEAAEPEAPAKAETVELAEPPPKGPMYSHFGQEDEDDATAPPSAESDAGKGPASS